MALKMHRHDMRMTQPALRTRSTEQDRLRGDTWMRIRERVLTRDTGLCVACRKLGLVTAAQEVDHIVPLERGGGNGDANLQSLCIPCHQAKSEAERKAGTGGRVDL